MKHLPHLQDLSKKDALFLLSLAKDLKKNPRKYAKTLDQKTLIMWFEKPSLRTRLSFEVGMTQLGGHAIYLDFSTTHTKKATLSDELKCISRYGDMVMARVFSQDTISEMISSSSIPVINGLSDLHHPCQALADIQTIIEHVGMNATIAYIGDGNNVCNSLIDAAKIVGMKITVACPFDLKPSRKPDFLTTDPKEAVKTADVVYTDTWVSMGEENEKERKIKKLSTYQVNKELLGNRFFMHCLPAIRGQEVTDEVIDSKKSIVFDQAENRLHMQKAIMLWLMDYENR